MEGRNAALRDTNRTAPGRGRVKCKGPMERGRGADWGDKAKATVAGAQKHRKESRAVKVRQEPNLNLRG